MATLNFVVVDEMNSDCQSVLQMLRKGCKK